VVQIQAAPALGDESFVAGDFGLLHDHRDTRATA
jgi:hypothetical protein